MQLVTGTALDTFILSPKPFSTSAYSTNLYFIINFNEFLKAYFLLQVISQLFQMAEYTITFFTFTGNFSITIICKERKKERQLKRPPAPVNSIFLQSSCCCLTWTSTQPLNLIKLLSSGALNDGGQMFWKKSNETGTLNVLTANKYWIPSGKHLASSSKTPLAVSWFWLG